MSWEKRHTPTGFLQVREVYDDGKKGRWQFQIYGFTGEPGTVATCSVYAVDGKRDCTIDAKDRVLIEGKWYTRKSWDH